MKKQTAVEWLMNDLIERKLVRSETPIKSFLNASLKQAKEMEKQQIIDAANIPIKDRGYDAIKFSNCGEQYYSKTYGK